METSLHKLHDQMTESTNSAVSNGESRPAPAESPLAGDSMEDEMRPVKKQKQVDLSDNIPDSTTTAGTVSSSNKNANELIQVSHVPTPTPTSNDAIEYNRVIIHPSIAEIMKLEDIPSVEPLEYLTLRETAGKLLPVFLLFLLAQIIVQYIHNFSSRA